MNHRLAPILTGTHQPDGDGVHIGVSVELRVATKAAHVSFLDPSDHKRWIIEGEVHIDGQGVLAMRPQAIAVMYAGRIVESGPLPRS